MHESGTSRKVMQAIGLLLVVAIGSHIVASLLVPLIPIVAATGLLLGVSWFLVKRHH